ncbi:hypothetical protein BDW62DRAFT_202957 [Aspergillus aurantiobrunneus]
MSPKPWWIDKSSASVSVKNGSRQWSTEDLSSYEAVRCQACTIYDQLRSRSMPITKHADDFWLPEALETFRRWANQGFRVTASDSVVCKLVIPQPAEKLDDVMQVGYFESLWQGTVHKYQPFKHYPPAATHITNLALTWLQTRNGGLSLWHRASLICIETSSTSRFPTGIARIHARQIRSRAFRLCSW